MNGRNRDDIKGCSIPERLVYIDGSHLISRLSPRTRNTWLKNTSACKVLQQFKDTKIHFGIVMDEYGQVQGMVMNDLLEALVGGADRFMKMIFAFEEEEMATSLLTDVSLQISYIILA